MTYTVKPGDNLTDIARHFYTSVSNLVEWNHIANPNDIYIGQVIYVTKPVVTAIPASWIVKAHETVDGIANLFGISPQTIIDLNHLANPNYIVPGEVLLLKPPPEPSPEPTPTPEPAPPEPTPTPEPTPVPEPVVRVSLSIPKVSVSSTGGVEVADAVPAATGSSTVTVYDSVDPANLSPLLSDPTAYFAAYVDGKYAWSRQQLAEFAGRIAVLITVTGSGLANACDLEAGDLTVDQAVAWAKANPGGLVYVNASTLEANAQALFGLNLWVAEWNDNPSLAQGWAGHQYASNSEYDTSIFWKSDLIV